MNEEPTPLGPLPVDDPLVLALSGALAREAAAITPSPEGLRRIQTRIEEQTRAARLRRRRLVSLGAAAASVALVAGGAALALDVSGRHGTQSGPPAGRSRPTGTALPTATPSGTTPPLNATGLLPVYYLGRFGTGYRLYREFHPLPQATAGQAARVQLAVTEAMSRPPDDPDYLSAWAEGAGARATLGPQEITIVLNGAAAAGTRLAGRDADAAAIQQLIWTATAAAASAGAPAPPLVRIEAEGPTPQAFGSLSLAQPFRRGGQPGGHDPRSAIWIDSLGQDAAVAAGPLTVQGEGLGGSPVQWRLTRDGVSFGSGQLTPTTATGEHLAAGVRGGWTLRLDLPAAGSYLLTVSESVAGGTASDTKAFRAG